MLVCREIGFSLAPRFLLPRVSRLVSGKTFFLAVATVISASVYQNMKISQVKSEVDPQGILGSGYVQGTLTLDHK